MSWSAVINARYVRRGSGGTTPMEGATRFRIDWSEKATVSQDAASLAPNDVQYVNLPIKVEIETENLSELLTMLTLPRAREKLRLGWLDTLGNKWILFNSTKFGEPQASDFPPADEAGPRVIRHKVTATVLSPAPGDPVTAIFSTGTE